MKHVLLAIAVYCIIFNISAQNTIRKDLVPEYDGKVLTETVETESHPSDSSTLFMPDKIILKNYEKKLQDARESFLIVNNTSWHISRLNILFRYTDMEGNVIHERTVMAECDLPGNSVRQTSVKTFDTQHQYCYYLSRQPRREARQFKVSVKILRYDIIAQ